MISKLVRFRNWTFDRGLQKVHRIRKPVISVGNLTVGGTGKTPMVIELVRFFQERGKIVAVISRNYKARVKDKCLVKLDIGLDPAREYGDEPVLVAKSCPGVFVFVGPSKSETAIWASENYPQIQIFIVDDGFQHRSLYRDFDLVLIDASDSEMNRMVPWGRAREPLEGLGRADWFCFTKVNLVEDGVFREIRKMVPSGIPSSEYVYETKFPETLPDRRVYGVAGLARPQIFFEQGKKFYKDKWVGEMSFPDHHRYSKSDVQKIAQYLNEDERNYVLLTEKDWVKLDGFLKSDRVLVAKLEIRPIKGAKEFHDRLGSVCK